ncbi:prolyl 4-hydroxylase 1 isoform X3 [Andrographis paniculata]|uniref:prolyl 4-hydroxylase 1 isoform X3 n=1 Tax=Andrographis paniculata TaxID=175694 RepID=UPI0021E6DFCB|nr:prolyl 4-hydroxylase 1 isoform X3 [Andrographis paniculata]
MAAFAMRFVVVLLTFVTVGMIIGALMQLEFIKKLDDSYGAKFSLTRLRGLRGGAYWGDQEDVMLRIGYVKPEVINWSPRIILFHNFLSAEGVKSKVRTSSGMFLSSRDRKYPIIQGIEKRISVYSQIPVENGERIQVLRYEKNQLYRPHHDYFSDPFNLKFGGQRVATMLMYLSDGVEGGETYFPKAGSGQCSCGGRTVTGLCVKPIKGSAVLFWSMGLDGQSDPRSLHGGCEVLSGEKWSATKWMRQNATS